MDHDDVVMIDLTAMLEKAQPFWTKDECVYKVPRHIRMHNEDAYTPQFVSIGPLHHNNPKLQNMERQKLEYCNKLLDRSKITLGILIRYIEKKEPIVRRCYSDTLNLNKEELVKVILVDSAFIIELFLRCSNGDESFLDKPWLGNMVIEDLLLLENQLPFFVLEKLFNFIFESDTNTDSSGSETSSFLKLTMQFFGFWNKYNLDIDDISSIHHFTDLLRTFHLHPLLIRKPCRKSEAPEKINLRSATELEEAGVRLRVSTERKCLLDLRFSRPVLEIPKIIVEGSTEVMFRNLVVFEQCHYPFESYMIDYVFILEFLISNRKDVDLLIKNGILVSWLSDTNSVVNMFNGLLKNIVHSDFSCDCLHLCDDLNAFCTSRWNNKKATLRRDYGNTPWKATASIAGIVLLILTLVQTVCSILQVALQ